MTKILPEDTLFGRLIKHKHNWTCERCGIQADPSSKAMQASHYIGRTWRTTRWDEDNVDVLCASCHAYFELRKGTDYMEWKKAKMGEEKFKELIVKGRESNPPDKNTLKEWRKNWREELRKYE